jgi:fibronectin type 3 domain-containing protein
LGCALNASPATAADPVIAAAGDIACSASSSNYNGGNGTADRCRMKYTSDLLVNAGLSAVLVLGDSQYESASLSGLNNSYNNSWGRVKSITRPAPGNHEYKTSGAAGYFDYFNGVGQQTGPAGDRSKGYYSFNVGTWHLIALNSTDHCTIISCAAGSAQETWLKADLAANADKYCTLAFWHDPRFNSGHDKNADEMAPLFKALYDADADVALGGHAHDYERFAPQNPNGQLDTARGIRQFVVGTGGAFWTSISTPQPNSEIRQNSTYGVLKLTLRPTSYDWQFVPEAGKTFTDSGTGQCHGGTPPTGDTQMPTAPQNLTATPGPAQVSLNWNASTDNVGVTGYRIFRDGTQIAAIGNTTSYTDTQRPPGTYTYTVRAVDAAGNVSNPSNTASTTVVDQKPTPPGNLTAIGTVGRVDLAWQAASDDVGVTGYRIFRDNVQIASIGTSTSYADTQRPPGTYSYVVRAVDTAGTLSDPSNTANGTVPDVQPPTIPGDLTGRQQGSYQAQLDWTASSDDVGVSGYDIQRNGAVVTTVEAGDAYTDQITTPGSYSYRVRARDAGGNVSGFSNAATVEMLPPDDSEPTAPKRLRLTVAGDRVDLEWDASTDNVGVAGYRLYRDEAVLAYIDPGTSYSDVDAPPGDHTYQLIARDAVNNWSDSSNVASASVPDIRGPSIPGNLVATAPSSTQVNLAWQASNDNLAVTGYEIYRDSALLATISPATAYTDLAVTPFSTYTYEIRAFDAAGNFSLMSNPSTVMVEPPDTQKPTAPAGLTATPASPRRVDLQWQPSSDNKAVTGYRVFRGGQLLASIGPSTSYADTGATPGTAHTYVVRAVDAAGNVSDPSNSVTVTTPPTVMTIYAEADARVHESTPTTNYGADYLRANGGTESDVETYIRFQVTGAPAGNVLSAKLRLYVYSGTADGPAVFKSDPNWSESAVNWSTRPALTSGGIDDKGSLPSNTWAEFDVTPFVTGNGTYSFALQSQSTDGVNMRQREYTSFWPELVVTQP